MARPPLEVADIFRAHGPAFRIANLLRDQEILEWAKREAAEFIANPPSPEEMEAFVTYLRTEWPRRYGLASVA